MEERKWKVIELCQRNLKTAGSALETDWRITDIILTAQEKIIYPAWICNIEFVLPNTYLSITCFHWGCWMKIAVFYNWPPCCTAGDMKSKERGGNLSNQASMGWDVTIITFVPTFLWHSGILISLRKSDCKSNSGQQILLWFKRDDIPNYEKFHLFYFYFM